MTIDAKPANPALTTDVNGSTVTLTWPPINQGTLILRLPTVGSPVFLAHVGQGVGSYEDENVPSGDYIYDAVATGRVLAANAVVKTTPKTLVGLWQPPGTLTATQATAEALGLPLTAVSLYGDSASWASISSGVPSVSPLTLLLAVPLCPAGGNDTSPIGNEAYYTTLGDNLIAMGAGDALCRIAWEPNGGADTPAITDPAQWIAGWQAIVTGLRAAGTPATNHLRMDYCCCALGVAFPNGVAGVDGWNDYYPGDAFVDVISIDFYENGWPEWYIANVMGIVNLAIAHGKAWGTGEWGLSGSDVPAYIEAMATVFKGGTFTGGDGTVYTDVPPALYQSYWNEGNSILTQFPNSLSTFRELFG
jgi:hypothetical protein